MNKDLLFRTFINTFIAAIYIFIVSQIMQNGEKFFNNNETLAPFVVLLLFSFSAAVVGGLVFGQSIMLFFEKKRTEGIKAAVYSISWLGIFTVLGLLALFVI